MQCVPTPQVSTETIQHLFLNQVVPLALSLQKKLVFHASGVEIDNEAIAFVGQSGMGKSTLAASFASHGFRFLADDGLHLEAKTNQYYVYPSHHPSLRLWEDSLNALSLSSSNTALAVSYTPKVRILADQQLAYCDDDRPLRCVYFLGKGNADQITIEPVSSRDAMIEMVRHSFLLDIQEHATLTHHFKQLTMLAKQPIFFRLDYPRCYEVLSKVQTFILDHLSSTQQSNLALDTTAYLENS